MKPHRFAKFFADTDRVSTFQEADSILRSLSVRIEIGPDLTLHDQLFIYTLVNIAHRCFLGGIYVHGEVEQRNRSRQIAGTTIREACNYLGAASGNDAPRDAPTVYVGGAREIESPLELYAQYGQWWGSVDRIRPANTRVAATGGALGAILAAGLVAASVFTYFERERNADAVVPFCLSLWTDTVSHIPTAECDGPILTYLPAEIWLVGLGHLGQAYAWLLGLLPYPARGAVRCIVQDDDFVELENYGTSALCRGEIGLLKTDLVKNWMTHAGFTVRRIERRITAAFQRDSTDPAVCLAGLDNAVARRWLANAGFPLLVDGGLGATARSFSRIKIHTFPSSRSGAATWPDVSTTRDAPHTHAYEALRDSGVDRCGLTTIANTAVAAPFAGTVASAVAIAQVLKLLHGKSPSQQWSYDVRSPFSVAHAVNLEANPESLSIQFCVATEH